VRRREYLCVLGTCLVLSVAMWWHVWTGSPTATSLCGCGDPALFQWYLAQSAFALGHGSSLFHASTIYPPGGLNLLANTSVLPIGILLAPVTWGWGPVASLNVALTLAPVGTGVAAFWLLRRWISWWPAALAGALLFSFSPLVLANSVVAHLQVVWLALIPLIVGCLDELRTAGRRDPRRVGLVLGLLVVVQFFVSSEMLAITVIGGGLGIAVLGLAGMRTDPARPRRPGVAWRRLGVGLACGGIVAGALLAYPAWYALAGPAALASPVWPHLGAAGATVAGLVVPSPTSPFPTVADSAYVGYSGALLPSAAFVGGGLLAVVIGGLACWRRDGRLWFWAVMAVVGTVLSLSTTLAWSPWHVLSRAPLLGNIAPERFSVITYLALGAFLAAAMEDARRWWLSPADATRRRRLQAAAVGGGVAALGLLPIVVVVLPALPVTVTAVATPRWFLTAGRRVPQGRVVLTVPTPSSDFDAPLAWQAANKMQITLAGAGGPAGQLDRVVTAAAGYRVLDGLSDPRDATTAPDRSAQLALRGALRRWGVQTVVIPAALGPPGPATGDASGHSVAVVTAALGERPVFRAGAWVWPVVDLRRPPLSVSAEDIDHCGAVPTRDPASDAVVSCVFGHAGTSPDTAGATTRPPRPAAPAPESSPPPPGAP
jgi:hypothetical protein